MKIVIYVLKNINILNIILLAVATGLFFTLAYPLLNADVKVKIPQVKPESVQKAASVVPVEDTPATVDYIIVTEKNLFHPERRMPLSKAEEEMVARPEIVLYGVIISGEKKIAYIEDKKRPYSTPGRGKRQTPVAQGALIGGYTLKEVNPETIVLVRGKDRMVVNLRDQKERQGSKPSASQQLPQTIKSPRAKIPGIP